MRERQDLQAQGFRILKQDLFGRTGIVDTAEGPVIRRDTRAAAWWLRWLAVRLMRREARALAVLEGLDGVPELLRVSRYELDRSYIAGRPLHEARPADARYFASAQTLVRRLHARDVAHNDLAKEPNLLVTPDGHPALIDFQLAWFAPRRGRLFRALARDDLRHLLKHKRTYCPGELTNRERAILATPSLPARLWMRFVKPPYLFVTRRILGWQDREGAGDRG